MGIRFYCPNGHKLHVKSFQAGRRGVCPYCGVTIDIPLTSTRGSGKDDKNGGAHGGSSSHEKHNGTGDSGINLNAIAPSSGGYAYPQSDQSFITRGQDKEIELSAPLDRSVAVPSMGAGAGSAMGGASMMASSTPSSMPSSSPSAPDPIRESPNSVWYVQPASGGQYGPATGDIMQSWLDEGRVAEDSMVWREGWPDWKEAVEVFPQLAPKKPVLDFSPKTESPAQNTTFGRGTVGGTSSGTSGGTSGGSSAGSLGRSTNSSDSTGGTNSVNTRGQSSKNPMANLLTPQNIIIAVQAVIILILIIVVLCK